MFENSKQTEQSNTIYLPDIVVYDDSLLPPWMAEDVWWEAEDECEPIDYHALWAARELEWQEYDKTVPFMSSGGAKGKTLHEVLLAYPVLKDTYECAACEMLTGLDWDIGPCETCTSHVRHCRELREEAVDALVLSVFEARRAEGATEDRLTRELVVGYAEKNILSNSVLRLCEAKKIRFDGYLSWSELLHPCDQDLTYVLWECYVEPVRTYESSSRITDEADEDELEDGR